MALNLGRLRHMVTIQQRVASEDAAGQPSSAWQEVATVWADIRLLSGLESIRANQDASIVRASIRIRHTQALQASLSPAMRVLHGTTVYQITAILPDLAARAHIDLTCEAVHGSV